MTTLFVSVNHTILSLKRQAVKAPCICSRLVIIKPLVYASGYCRSSIAITFYGHKRSDFANF